MNYLIQVARSPSGPSPAASRFRLELEDRMTVLDALFKIQRECDATLAFRCACRVGMCGTCAVSVNRIPRLACATLLKSLRSEVVVIGPLPHLPVVQDLVVSLEPFFAQWKRILPALRPKDPKSRELARVPAGSRFARLAAGKRDCITCGICHAACGISGTNRGYLGPAAINKAFLRMLDPRDGAGRERAAVLDDQYEGVWRCHTQFNCTAACPKGIRLTDSIVRIKRGMLWPGKLLSP